jgi:hypothetical protein
MLRAAYHFARPELNGAQAEAQYFIANLPTLETGDGVALDFEVGVGDLAAWADAWEADVSAAVGFNPLFYTYPSFITEHNLTNDSFIARFPLWFASYQGQEPTAPGQWKTITIWQHSSTAVVPGVAGQVDEDITSLTRDQLKALGKPAPVTKAPSIEDEATAYYGTRGFTVDKTHALWTDALLPLYVFWKGLADSNHPMADLVKPGTLAGNEVGVSWGHTPGAGAVRLSNREVGVHSSPSGWVGYQTELF